MIKKANYLLYVLISPSRNEARFMAQHGITRIDMTLEDFAEALAEPVRVPA